MSRIADLNVKIGATLDGLDEGLKKTEKKLQRSAKKWNELGNNLSMSLTLPIVGFLGKSAQLFDTQAQAIAQVEAGIKSTGGVAGKTSEELQKIASSLQNITTFGDEAILEKVTANMLTFTNVTGEQFDKAQLAVLNLSTRLKTDLKSATLQVGKALNDPIKGVSALAEAGIQFTASQNATIKSLVETGQAAKAQEIILKELEVQFGGSAEAAAKAGLGPVKQFQNAMGDAFETIGGTVLPILTKLAGHLKTASEWFAGLSDGTRDTIVTTMLLVAAIGPAIKIIGIYKSALLAGTGAMRSLIGFTKTAAGTILTLADRFAKMDMVMKATTIGLVVAGMAALVLVVNQLNSRMTDAQRVQATMSSVQVEAAKAIAAERLEAEKLTGILNDENKTREQKAAALRRLKEINSEYFGQLDIEKSKVNDVNAALQSYIKSIEQRAKLAAANEKLIDIEKELMDVTQQLEEADPSFWQSMGNAVLSGGNAMAFAGKQARSFSKNIDENRKSLEAQKKALLDFISTAEGSSPVKTPSSPSGDPQSPSGLGSKIKPIVSAPDLLPSTMDMATAWNVIAASLGDSIKKSTPQVAASTDGFKNALSSLGNQFDIIEAKSAVFGSAFDPLNEKINATKSAIMALLEEGANPFGGYVTYLNELLAGFQTQLDETNNRITGMNELVNMLTTSTSTMAAVMGSTLSATFQQVESGVSSFKKLGAAALGAAAKEVRGAVMAGVAQAVKSALTNVPFPFNVAAAGLAGAAAGTLFNKLLGALKIPALAGGGLAMGPTLAVVGDNPGARSNPEVIAPLSKLENMMGGGGRTEVFGTLRGNDIYLSNKRYSYTRGRVSGR